MTHHQEADEEVQYEVYHAVAVIIQRCQVVNTERADDCDGKDEGKG